MVYHAEGMNIVRAVMGFFESVLLSIRHWTALDRWLILDYRGAAGHKSDGHRKPAP